MNGHAAPRPVGALAVVVPAHDEAVLLPRALAALRTAAGHAALKGAALCVVVVAGSCCDGTADAARTAGADVIEVTARNVGIARHAGIRRALRLLGTPESDTWIATTDADSRVPPDWLAHQSGGTRLGRGRQHRHGAGLAAVLPGRSPRAPRRHLRGISRSPHAHRHVHGANLGVSAPTYRAVGGFPPLVTGEDVALVTRLDNAGFRVLRTTDCPVDTSARRNGRAPGDFSGHLRDLALDRTAILEPHPPACSTPHGDT